MEITLIILSIVFSILSGFSKAICDLSEEGKLFMFDKDLNLFFWIKAYSWKNKWKLSENREPIIENGKYVERFWGSSRWFVSFTDAWHLFGLIERVGFIVTYVSIGILIMYSNWYWLMLLNYPLFALIFHLFYNSKILRKW
jgi:hypothetical protein